MIFLSELVPFHVNTSLSGLDGIRNALKKMIRQYPLYYGPDQPLLVNIRIFARNNWGASNTDPIIIHESKKKRIISGHILHHEKRYHF
jgi:hypothetical protein